MANSRPDGAERGDTPDGSAIAGAWQALSGYAIWVLVFRGIAAAALYLAVRDESIVGRDYQFLAFVVSFSSISQGLDFGLGNAVTHLATRLPKHQQSLLLVRRLVARMATAFGGLSGVIVTLLVLMLPIGAVGLSGDALVITALGLGASTGLNVRAAGFERTLIGLGYHRMSMIASAAVAATTALALLAVVSIAPVYPGAWIALLSGALLKVLVFQLCVRKVAGTATLDPSTTVPRDVSYRGLARSSGIFFALQLVVFVAFQSDTLVANAVGGPETTRIYATSLRFFIVIPGIVGILCLPIWRSFATAIACGDGPAAWRQFIQAERLIVAASLFSSAVVAIVLVLDPARFLGGDFPVWFGVIWIGWAAVLSWGQIVAHMLASLNELRYQLALAVLMMLANLGLSIWATNKFGGIGPALGTLVSYLAIVVVPARFRAQKLIVTRRHS